MQIAIVNDADGCPSVVLQNPAPEGTAPATLVQEVPVGQTVTLTFPCTPPQASEVQITGPVAS